MLPYTPPAPPWQKMRDLPCHHVDPDIFHPDTYNAGEDRAAKQVCGGCPIRAACARWSIDHAGEHGVWGALNPDDRQKVRDEIRRRRTGSTLPERPQPAAVPWSWPQRTDTETVDAILTAAADFLAGWGQRGNKDRVRERHTMTLSTFSEAAQVLRHAPELIGDIRAGLVSMTAAIRYAQAVGAAKKRASA
jgi:WhiB family redox-sensing transcriptional regulator